MDQIVSSIQKVHLDDSSRPFITSKNVSITKTDKDKLTICKSESQMNDFGKVIMSDIKCKDVKVKDMTFEDIIESMKDMHTKLTKSSRKSHKKRTKKVSKTKKTRK